MKKWLAVLLLVMTLAVIAVIAAPFVISTDTIKREVITRIESATGRKLTIEGELHITLFPSIGVSAEKVTLSNPSSFEEETAFVTLGALKVTLALMPLLERNVDIKSFTLQDPIIYLHETKNGARNWDFARKDKITETDIGEGVETASSSSFPSLLAKLQLNDVSIKNGSIVYVNDAQKSRFEIGKLNTTLSLAGIDAPLSLDGSGEWNGKTVSIKTRVATLASLLNRKQTDVEAKVVSEDITMHVQGTVATESFTGKVEVQSPSLKRAYAWIEPANKRLVTPAVLKLDAKGDVRCNTRACDVSQLDMSLDTIKAKGSVKLAMLENKPLLTLDVMTNVIDLNPFITTENHAESWHFPWVADAFAEPGHHWSDDPISFAVLGACDVNAVIRSEGLRYKQITLGSSTISAKLQKSVLAATITDLALYGGKAQLALNVDANVSPAAVTTRGNVQAVDLEPMLKDVADLHRFSGKGDISWNLNMRGNTQETMIQSLDGSGALAIRDGEINQVNMLDMLRNVQSAFSGAEAKNTTFSTLSGNFTTKSGVINNQDLLLVLQGLRVNGQGSIDLPAYSIHYRLSPQLQGRDAYGKAAAGLTVPVLIQGSLDHPQFQPDVASVLQDALSDPKKLREQLKNSERSLKDQLKGSNGDAIKNLKGLLKGL